MPFRRSLARVSLSLFLLAFAAPVFAQDQTPTADPQNVNTVEDTPVAITLTGSDPQGDPLTFAIAQQPGNGSLSGTAPNVTYTPDPGFNGNDSFTFTVNDGTNTSAPATVSISVASTNSPPTANAQNASTAEGTPVAITLTGSDPDSDPLTFAIAQQPGNGSLSGTAPNVTYTPDPGFNGNDSFTFTVNDGEATSAPATVSISVASTNSPPTANAQNVSTDEGTPVAITLTGSDPDSDPLTFAIAQQPGNGSLSGTAPNVTYTPDPGFNGNDSFTFTVDDGEATSAPATVSITIAPVNDPPTANPQNVATDEDTGLAITLTGSDPEDGAVGLTFQIALQPQRGTLTGTPPNVMYSPNADFNGSDGFTFTVRDTEGLTSAPATVAITVRPINDNPILLQQIPDQVAVETFAFSLNVSANFDDVDGDNLTYSATGLPPSLAPINQNTGVINGTPTFDEARDVPYVVTVTASDGVGGSIAASDTFDLTVSALDRANVSMSVSGAPDPAMSNDQLRWTFVVQNSVGPQAAVNVELDGAFFGQGLTVTSASSCTIGATQARRTPFNCTIGGIPVGGSTQVLIDTTTSQPGDVTVFATAAGADIIPLDPNPNDNIFQYGVGVADAFSNGAVQMLGNSGIRSTAIGDINNDGALDLVNGTIAGQPVQVWLSNGFRDFVAAPTVADNGANEGVALGDFNGDGNLDLVVVNGGGQMDRVYQGDGLGNFSQMANLTSTNGNGVAVGFFNSGNNLDIAVAATGGNPIFHGNGSGGFNLQRTLGTADSRDVAAADFNNDGLDDVVFANVGSASRAWNGGRNLTLDQMNIGDATSVAVGQFGGSNRPDVVFGRIPGSDNDVPSNPVLIANNNGSFANPSSQLGTAATLDVGTGDVNGDSLDDIVFINASGLHQVWNAQPGGGFSLHVEQIIAAGAVAGAVAELGFTDVGEPGGADLAMGGFPAPGLGVYLNDGFGNLGRGDAVPPVITLNGEATVDVPSGTSYIDAGATATDNINGDITTSIVATNDVNTAIVGAYTVTFNVQDFAGNAAVPVIRTVNVTPSAGTGGGGGAMPLSTLVALILAVLLLAICNRMGPVPARIRHERENNQRNDA